MKRHKSLFKKEGEITVKDISIQRLFLYFMIFLSLLSFLKSAIIGGSK